MEIQYGSKALRKTLENKSSILKNYNSIAKNLLRRLDQLLASDNLADIGKLPGFNCHELKGDKKGLLSINITGNWRLIISPCNEPIPKKPDGGLDWSGITKISIESIEDYN